MPDDEKDLPQEFLTINQAAKELGVSLARVSKAVKDGVLPHTPMFEKKLLRRQDLEEYRARTQPDGTKKIGRPRKPKAPPP